MERLASSGETNFTAHQLHSLSMSKPQGPRRKAWLVQVQRGESPGAHGKLTRQAARPERLEEKRMERVEINNCFTLEIIEYNGSVIKGQFRDNKSVELENGIWLRSMGDGRYYDDKGNSYCEVTRNIYDDDDNIIEGELIGWAEW